MFKQGISVPGLTLLYLFNDFPEKTYFTIFNEKNKDLHDLVKDNIVGGPSIIFHRYHEKGVTTLRQNEYGEVARPCRSIVGYDANALYLWSLMQVGARDDGQRRTSAPNRRSCTDRWLANG